MNPLVSIIVPTFNSEKFISETLESVCGQSYQYWECLVVDDGSSDGTANVVDAFVKAESRIQFTTRPKGRLKGANACRNIGIEKSKGNFLIFLDADDTLFVNNLQNRVAHFGTDNTVQGLIFSTGILNEDGSEIIPFVRNGTEGLGSKEYAKMFLSYDFPWQTTDPIWKREVFDTYGGFDEQLGRFQDVDMYTKLMLFGVSVKKIECVDFCYKIEEGSVKYDDETFIKKACYAILYYIEKYVKPSNVYILDEKERKDELSVMFLKTIRKFIHNKNRSVLFKEYLQFEKRHKLIPYRKRLLLTMLFVIDKWQLLHIKGLGFYRLEKYIRARIFKL